MRRTKRQEFWSKHLGSDVLAGVWIFAALGVGSSVLVIILVLTEPWVLMNWAFLLAIVPFGVGSLLLVRVSYPETMNTSFCCSWKEEEEIAVQEEEKEGYEKEEENLELGETGRLIDPGHDGRYGSSLTQPLLAEI